MADYTAFEYTDTETVLKNNATGNAMIVSTRPLFSQDNDNVWFRVGGVIPGTARSAEYYNEHMRDGTPTAEDLVLEVGAGLGGWIPSIVDRLDNRPVVIDPFDYQAARELLYEALERGFEPEFADQYQDLIARCDVYQDPTKVELYNTDFLTATDGKLWSRRFDVVVDMFGAQQYKDQSSFGMDVKTMEHFLVKDGGQLVVKTADRPLISITI